MIHVLQGRSGSGKSHQILQALAHHARAGERAVLLVPEQYTLQAERDLITETGMGGLLHVEVMSPGRLAREVLRRSGQDAHRVVDPLGRVMALRRVADGCREKLSLFAHALRRPHFCGELAELLGDMKRFDVDTAALRRATQGMDNGILNRKLNDICQLMEALSQLMEGRSFWDPEDRMNAFVDALRHDTSYGGIPFYLDGFDYLPPQSVRMVCALERACGQVTLALDTALPGDLDAGIFAAGEASLHKVQDYAQQEGILVQCRSCMYNPPQKPDALKHLERHLFSHPLQAFGGSSSCLRLTQALTRQEEIEVCAGRILALIQKGLGRYRDIAVVCAELAAYAPDVERTFRKWGIPVFLDTKRSAFSHPLAEVLMAALQTLAWGWREHDLLRLAKTGLLPLASDEVEAVHMYLHATRRRGRVRLAVPWTESLPMLKEVNLPDIQTRLLQPLIALEDAVIQDASAVSWARALTALLKAWEVDCALEAMAQEETQSGRNDLAQESTQLWDVAQSLLEQMAILLGDTPLEAQEVMGMLEAGFAQAQIGILPAQNDAVLVGDVGRTKLPELRYLFVLGAKEGAFPTRYAAGSILTDRDMDQLSGWDLEVGRDAGLRSAQSRFGAYAALTKPTRGCTVSYALSDLSGETALPSRLVSRIGEMFGIRPERPSMWELPAPELHIAMVSQALRDLRRDAVPEGPWKRTLSSLYASDRYGRRMGDILSALTPAPEEVPGGIPGARYSSISRLEQYARCPFAWFMEYAMKPQEWDTLQPDPLSEGSYIHEALYHFSCMLQEQDGEPDDNWVNTVMERITEHMRETAFAGTLGQTAVSKYMEQRLLEICQRTARGIARQCRRGEFRPVMLEESFGPGSSLEAIGMQLPDGSWAQLSGKVDRVDVFSMGDVDYIRIIDYKSGQKDVELAGVKDGYQLQLWIYLDALCRGWKARTGREGRPAGVFYCPARDTYDTVETVEEGMPAEPQALRGMMMEDEELIHATDRDWQPGVPSRIVNIPLRKDASMGKKGCSPMLLEAIRRGTMQTVQRILQDGSRGRIAPSPLQLGQEVQCSHCAYRAGCQNGLVCQYPPRKSAGQKQVDAWLEGLMKEVKDSAALDREAEDRY